MADLQKCLDFSLKAGNLPNGDAVAKTLGELESDLTPFITPSQLKKLRSSAKLATKRATLVASNREDTHPLNKYANESPIYTSLATHIIRPYLAVHVAKALKTPQTLLLLHHLDLKKLSNSEISQLSSFCRRFSKATPETARLIANNTPSEPSVRSLDECIRKLEKPDNNFEPTNSDQKRIEEYVSALTLWRDFVLGTTTQAQNIDVDTNRSVAKALRKKTTKNRFCTVDSYVDEKSENEPAEVDTTLLLGDKKCPPEALLTLAQHGHWLRLNRAYAGRSDESLAPPAAKIAIESILSLSSIKGAEKIAILIWKLVAITGHPFDQIYAVITKQENVDFGVLKDITKNGTTYHWVSQHVIEKRLPVPALDKETATDLALQAKLPASSSDDNAWTSLQNSKPTREFNNAVLKAKKKIRKQLRQIPGLNQFTESRLRGTVIQAVFRSTYDIPLTQYMFGERLQYSAAGLHYLTFDQRYVQNTLNLALYHSFGDFLPHNSLLTPRIIVGAPKANIEFDVLHSCSQWFNNQQDLITQPLRKQNLTSKHNAFARSAIHLLSISSAHRQTKDLTTITLNDICILAGLAIYRDKPSNAAVFRRVACFPSQTIRYLQKYLLHLETLLRHSSQKGLIDIADTCRAATDGSGPLFFELTDEATTTAITAPSQIALDAGLNSEQVNIARHLQSTKLRDFGAPPLLVECHLGHQISGPMFSSNGLVSPLELSRTLRSFLDRWLSEAGYQPAQHLRETPRIPTNRGTDFRILVKQDQQADAQQLGAQLRKGLREALPRQQRQSLVDSCIQSEVPSYSPNNPPQNISLNYNQVVSIRGQIGTYPHSNLASIERSLKQLRQTLKRLRMEKGWKIDMPAHSALTTQPPIPITSGHIAAANCVYELRKSLIKSALNSEFSDDVMFSAALLLWGQANSIEQAISIAAAVHDKSFIVIDYAWVIYGQEDLKDSSRSVGGIPLLFAKRWRDSATDFDPAAIRTSIRGIHDHIESACMLAQYIDQPFALADVSSNTLPHKEAHAKDLARLTQNTAGDAYPQTHSHRVHKELDQHFSITKTDREAFRALRKTILSPPKTSKNTSAPKQRSALNAVASFKSRAERSPLISLFTDWAIVLLGENANNKYGGRLKAETVTKYLLLAWEPLARLLATYSISELEDDQFIECLQASLSSNPSLQESQAQALNRLSSEVWQSYSLPPICLSSTEDKNGNIDAGFITQSEHAAITKHIATWKLSPEIAASAIDQLEELTILADVYYQTGMRRNEALYLQRNDICSHQSTWASIRWHQKRSVKTPASQRYLPVPAFNKAHGASSTARLFESLSPPAENRILRVFSQAIQEVTGNPSARIHHYRHTIGSLATINGFSLDDPVERIQYLSSAVADLGHASIRTTLQHYGHASHYCIARRQASDIDELLNVEIAALIRKKSNAIKTMRSRYGKGRSLALSLAKAKRKPPQKSLKIPLPSGMQASGGMDEKDWLAWLHKFSSGLSAQAAAAEYPVTASQLLTALKEIELTGAQVNWYPVHRERLTHEIAKLSNHQIKALNSDKQHKRFPKEVHGALIGKASIGQELYGLVRRNAFGLKLTENQPVIWRTSAQTKEQINNAFKEHHISIQLTQGSSTHDYQPSTSSAALDQKHFSNCCRLIFFFLIWRGDAR